ncbi:MAG: TIGR01459 family HAD-type hydrolase [Rhodobacterales bacterium]|jgi:HAD superfamily hydrolase (TIGR01459 family)|nr:TIGR01459 family HAD-type hydrolase [Rhodobacterales bacterium]MBT6834231.1 TIGR01459 family HAD-type hydrolase [Rhodobacterales bacterium]MDA9896153.1 TIGR01459 family HAD-type hydrolase [Amylibacter sp.]MDC1410955.1 TIGR01459 family HAD-type hydrolase [Amylibacter sp.]
MTKIINSISEIVHEYDAIVFDQWGVLHDGKVSFKGAIECLNSLKKSNVKLAVLSNSGKRSQSNAERISMMGFSSTLFETIMTSGEALWTDISSNIINEKKFFPIERDKGDAKLWAGSLDISFEDSVHSAQAILLMGLPDGNDLINWTDILEIALDLNLPLYCSNPDLLSPRPGGKLITAAGVLAHHYRECGGRVVFYGKPHEEIFKKLQNILNSKRILMVGDSLDHDILGGFSAGWDTLLVKCGIHAPEFVRNNDTITLKKIINLKKCKPPTYLIESVK